MSKQRFRADQLFYAQVALEDGEELGYVCVLESGTMQQEAEKAADKMKRKAGKQGTLKPITLLDLSEIDHALLPKIPSPATGEPGSLTEPRAFNLMFQTQVGAMSDASASAYLRPETAQGIFVNFKNVVQTTRTKLPFGIAQIGKAFRNEITPRNFIFRSREFEQMEIEYVSRHHHHHHHYPHTSSPCASPRRTDASPRQVLHRRLGRRVGARAQRVDRPLLQLARLHRREGPCPRC